MNSRVIPLTVTSSYARSWGTWEGIRELVQNWHDGLHSVAAMLDDLPLDTSVKLEFRYHKSKTEQKYEAFIFNPKTNEEIILGHLTYNWLDSRLILTNQCTALQKKILLLGYSVKAETKEVIGQFGEGLKIGALALVRQGHLVSMETGNDSWEFQLLHNEEFGEKVLTVVISERLDAGDGNDFNRYFVDMLERRKAYIPPQTGKLGVLLLDCRYCISPGKESPGMSSTCTRVSGVEVEHWKMFLPRFLFLQPPNNCVKTELGTLLLDSHHAGQLYMKGIWVSNLKNEDLATGVDFIHLQVDRDRNAVPKPSEIDHQVSGMWIRALKKKPSLAQEYFFLLMNDKFRDVRHAAEYATPEMAMLVADEFLKKYGENAFPVLNQTEAQNIQAVKDELRKTAVLCTDTLIQLLVKSGRYDTLSTALGHQRSAEVVVVPYTALTSEQRTILLEATALINVVDPCFQMANVDIVQTNARGPCSVRECRMRVPTWMMDLDAVHQEMDFDPSVLAKHEKCKCRESMICMAVLDTRKDLLKHGRSSLVSPGYKGGQPLCIHPLTFVVTELATQVCRRAAEAYCADIHKKSSGTVDNSTMADFKQREESYLKLVASLEHQLELSQAESIESLEKMERKLTLVETQLVQKEVDLVNEETLIQNKFEQQLRNMRSSAEESVKGLQTKIDSLEQTLLNLRQQEHFKDRQIAELKEKLEEVSYAMEKKNNVLLEELSHYITQNRNRTVSLSRISKEGCQNEDHATREKWTLISSICDMVLEDLQSEKFICAVCKIKRKSHLLQPCGHYALCENCANHALVQRWCPVCKQPTQSHIKVFE